MSEKDQRFNIRVYGILINEKGDVLLSTEERMEMHFTKFPGGGLQWGEGITDCLHREFKEELGIAISIKELFYLTEHFQDSVFRNHDQLISVYYLVEKISNQSIENGKSSMDPNEINNHFYWHSIPDLSEESVTFPIDKLVIRKIKENS
jgi:ADP-ribose pyrophosphatase YjhB (NUDIX family)